MKVNILSVYATVMYLCLFLKINTYNRSTSAEYDREGSVLALDRHGVYSGNLEVLTQFHLYRPYGNQIAYEFTCSTNFNVDTGYQTTHSTALNSLNSNDKQSVNFLDRHTIQCPEASALVGFRMRTNDIQIFLIIFVLLLSLLHVVLLKQAGLMLT